MTAATLPQTLTAADRCDRCGAQAYVRVVLPMGELLFCGHHAHEHAAAYHAVATHIQDERDRLRPSESVVNVRTPAHRR